MTLRKRLGQSGAGNSFRYGGKFRKFCVSSHTKAMIIIPEKLCPDSGLLKTKKSVLFNPQAPVELVFRRLQREGVDFFTITLIIIINIKIVFEIFENDCFFLQ